MFFFDGLSRSIHSTYDYVSAYTDMTCQHATGGLALFYRPISYSALHWNDWKTVKVYFTGSFLQADTIKIEKTSLDYASLKYSDTS